MKRTALALACALLAACGGGGGSPAPAGAPVSGGASGSSASVTVVIAVPRSASATARTPQYVSAGTASAAVTVSGVTTSAPCAAPATTCTVEVAAPLGSDTFAVTLYDASLNVLASGTTTATVTANVVNTISLTFDGVVSSFAMSLSAPTITVGAAATSVLTIVPKDAAGYTIVQPGNYTQPVVITQSPPSVASISTSGATTITAIPASASTITITYNGGAAPASVAYTATAGSATQTQMLGFPAPGGVTVSEPLLQFTTVPASAQTETVSETNYAGTFSDNALGCSGIASVGAVSGSTISTTPIAVGSCTVTVSDTVGNSQTFAIHVATTTITGS
jgi:hypothetical protein